MAPLYHIPKTHGHPKSMNNLTLNESAKMQRIEVLQLTMSTIPDIEIIARCIDPS